MLNVISCDTCCGACCLTQESPPGYLLALLFDHPIADDSERLQAMPEQLKQELLDYAEGIRQKRPHPKNGACLWLDLETRKCLHYDLRPSVCRTEVVPGDLACIGWREAFEVK